MSWQVATFAALALVLAGGFAWYERSHPPARLVALVAALAALAVAGRLVLAPIPNVVATTDIALITGYALGPAPGFAVGALAAPISNIWLGQGPWTVWQMAGWGLAGLGGAWLGLVTRRRLGRFSLAAACGFAGFAYGALLDLSVMVTYGGEQSLDRYLALSARGLPFNVAHALGNIAFALAAGPALVRMISRYRTRLRFRWHPAGVLPLVLIAALLVAPSTFDPTAADAKRSTRSEVVSWLVAQQQADGGFAASPEYDSNPAMTGWVMMGLEAAAVNPLDVRSGGETPISYLRARVDRLRSANDLERTILALRGAGVDPRRFAGIDLVAALRERRAGDGSVSGQVNLTAFYVLALRAGGVDRAELGRSVRWLRAAQNDDGGWGLNPGAPSEPDTTGAALQALASAGAGGNSSASGVRWLRRAQRGGGGWGLMTSGVVNAQSTAWAVQGLIAAGGGGAALGDGLAYLERLRVEDGHYSYSETSDQTPIWVTAQVLLAVEREPLPLAPVAREPRPPRSNPGADEPATEPTGASGGGGQPTASGGGATRHGGREHGPGPGPGQGHDDGPGKPHDGQRPTKPEAASPSDAERPAVTMGEPAAAADAATPAGATDTSGNEDGAPTGAYVALGLGALALGFGLYRYRRRAS